jgi:hypothetical protein
MAPSGRASASASSVLTVATPRGPARVHLDLAPDDEPGAPVLVLGHGAGGGVASEDLDALARALPSRGIHVLRVEQPWRVAGRRVAEAPPRLDEAWLAVLHDVAVQQVIAGARRLVLGGRSAGARVACRTARAVGAAGCVAVAFPLHPPGRPERSRADELAAVGVPVLVVQGQRDPFGAPDEVRQALPGQGVLLAVPGTHTVRRADVPVEAVAMFVIGEAQAVLGGG